MPHPHLPPLSLLALGCAAAAAVILTAYLVRRPALNNATRVWLLLGLGVLPIGAAALANLQGFEVTKRRSFCGSCHVMTPHTEDADSPTSGSLASRHARNELFGQENCYVCHADYGMFGTVLTKLAGLEHVRMYYTEYRGLTLAEARPKIHLYKPYPNENCMQCHSTRLDLWGARPEHAATLDELRAGRLSCASGACHGFAHPFSKPSATQVGP